MYIACVRMYIAYVHRPLKFMTHYESFLGAPKILQLKSKSAFFELTVAPSGCAPEVHQYSKGEKSSQSLLD